MKDDFKYPTMKAAVSVLTKLGIDPDSRLNNYAQDFEYTSCKLEELEDYLLLYIKEDTSDREKRVLGCYLVECLNDYLQENKICHPKQDKIFKLLFDDKSIHKHRVISFSLFQIINYLSDNQSPFKRTSYFSQARACLGQHSLAPYVDAGSDRFPR